MRKNYRIINMFIFVFTKIVKVIMCLSCVFTNSVKKATNILLEMIYIIAGF